MSKKAFQINKRIEEILIDKGTDVDQYSEEERLLIAQFTGYGGLDKFGASGEGILYEFYTPPAIIKKMWGLALKHGFDGGKVLEPSAGIGEFMKYAPNQSQLKRPATFTAVEIDDVSSSILSILYPGVRVIRNAFESLFINPKNKTSVKDKVTPVYQLVIGNPPYGDISKKKAKKFFTMGEDTYTKANSYDQYFIMRGLDLLEPDGLLIFVIGTLDGTPFLQKGWTATKKKIAARADLIEAFRLPNGVFDRTDVLSDIIVLRKK